MSVYDSAIATALRIIQAKGFQATLRHWPVGAPTRDRLSETTSGEGYTDYPIDLAVFPVKGNSGSDKAAPGTLDNESKRTLVIAGATCPVNPEFGDLIFTIEGGAWKVENNSPLGPDNATPIIHKTTVKR